MTSDTGLRRSVSKFLESPSKRTDYSLNPFMPKGYNYDSPENYGYHIADALNRSPFKPLKITSAMKKKTLSFKNDNGWPSILPTAKAYKASLQMDAPRKPPNSYGFVDDRSIRRRLDVNVDPFANSPGKGKDPI